MSAERRGVDFAGCPGSEPSSTSCGGRAAHAAIGENENLLDAVIALIHHNYVNR